MKKICSICGKPLNKIGDPTSQDCGGDCVECMAQAGDPACLRSMQMIKLIKLHTQFPDAKIVTNVGASMFSGWGTLQDILFHPRDKSVDENIIELIFD